MPEIVNVRVREVLEGQPRRTHERYLTRNGSDEPARL